MALVALTVALGTVSLLNIGRMNSSMKAISAESLPGLASIVRLDTMIPVQRAFSLRHMLSDNPDQMTQTEALIAELENKFQVELKNYEKTITMPWGRELFEKIPPANDRFRRVWARIQPLVRASKQKEATTLWFAEGLP